jgi:hypothetical protein
VPSLTTDLFAHPEVFVLRQPVDSMAVLDDSTFTIR